MNRLFRSFLSRPGLCQAVLALCLLGQLCAPALGLALPCAMPAGGEHAMVMEAHDSGMVAVDSADCCQDEGPCLMAQCMAPTGACAAPPALERLPVAAAGAAAPLFTPRVLPRRHFRPPIAA
ncbi:MAG: hypothetical protein ACX93N_02795 [Pseudohaliea sp.]